MLRLYRTEKSIVAEILKRKFSVRLYFEYHDNKYEIRNDSGHWNIYTDDTMPALVSDQLKKDIFEWLLSE